MIINPRFHGPVGECHRASEGLSPELAKKKYSEFICILLVGVLCLAVSVPSALQKQLRRDRGDEFCPTGPGA